MKANELTSKIAEGLYYNNIVQIARRCRELSKELERCVPYYVLSNLLYELAGEWDKGPVLTEEVKRAEQLLQQPILDILAALEDGYSAEKMLHLLTGAIQAYYSFEAE